VLSYLAELIPPAFLPPEIASQFLGAECKKGGLIRPRRFDSLLHNAKRISGGSLKKTVALRGYLRYHN